MKAIIAIALCLAYVNAAGLTATKTLYCMAVSETVDNSCTACFNWNNAPRYLVLTTANGVTTGACSSLLSASKVTDCEQYNSSKANDTKSTSDCSRCKGGKVIVGTVNTGGTTFATTCEKSSTTKPSLDKANCESGNTRYYQTAAAGAYTVHCTLCKSGKAPTTVTNAVYIECNSKTAIANCDRGAANGLTTVGCAVCKSGYARNNAATGCVKFSDKNCMKLDTANTKCQECWPAYIFSGTVCVKAAKILSVIALAAAAIFLN